VSARSNISSAGTGPVRGPDVADGVTWAGVWSALPDFALAAQFLLMWIDPKILGAEYVSLFVGLMVAEFIVIHSSVFLGHVLLGGADRFGKAKAIVLIGLFYSLFFLGISLAVGAWYYLFAFWLLIANRLLGLWLGQVPTGEERALMQRGWAVTTLTYLLGVFATLFLPLPELGLTSSVVSSYGLPGEGVWVDEPHRAIAFGLLYYAVVGWSELYGHRSITGVRPSGR
jgi:hypothetical protein